MRRLLTGFVVAVAFAVVPALALADNQQVAEEIANRFKTSGQMSDYKIGVKYQNRMAWLHGRVSSAEQMKTALRLTFKTASVDRVVNELTIAPSEAAEPVKTELVRINVNDSGNCAAATSYNNPLREQSAMPVATARQPQKTGFLARLEAASWRKPKTEASQPLPVREAAPARDDQVPSSKPSTIRQVAAEEPQELPSPNYGSRPAARVAMMQPPTHGPMAPNAAPPMPMY